MTQRHAPEVVREELHAFADDLLEWWFKQHGQFLLSIPETHARSLSEQAARNYVMAVTRRVDDIVVELREAADAKDPVSTARSLLKAEVDALANQQDYVLSTNNFGEQGAFLVRRKLVVWLRRILRGTGV